MKGLQKLFDPASIAIIGASNEPGSVGLSLMKNLVGSGYKGTVYPVNPNRKNVFGIRCYKNVLLIPEEVDLAIIAIPAVIVPSVLRDCVKAKTKSVIVVSSGFGEIGKKGQKLEQEISRIIKGTGIRVLGPNCLGYIRPDKKINASFATRNAFPGKLALISQSGALCSSILDWALKQKVGFKYFISVGAMRDINFADLIEFIEQDKDVESIAIYMETIKDSKKFMKEAIRFSKSKPIIVAKSGQFEESAKAAISHTGSMAGNDAVFDAAFRRAGIVRVENVQDLLGCAKALASQPLPKGNRLAIITNAGGPGVMATDSIIKNGCKLASLSGKTMAKLDRVLPKHWSRNNPIDVLGDAPPERYEAALNIVLKEKNVDGVIVILSPQAITKPTEVAKIVARKAKKSKKTVLGCWMGEDFVEPAREVLRKKGLPSYRTPEKAVRVFSYMNSYRENIANLYEKPKEIEVKTKPNKKRIKAIFEKNLARKNTVLDEVDSKEILEEYGIPVNKTVFAKNVKEAVKQAKAVGFPVALKVVSDEITHKTDANAIALNVVSEKAIPKAFRQITLNARKASPKAKIRGVSVQKMVAGHLELILGAKQDSVFGPVILFGMGGVATELFQDKSIGLPPLNQTLAKNLIRRTKVYRLLAGYRKKFKIDLLELEQILIAFSQFVLDFPEIEEIDLNPIMVSEGKLFAVDARIVLSSKKKKN